MLTETEERRYRRQIMLPELGREGQIKLKEAKILVVGAGGLGSPVLQYLTAMGVGNIVLMDDDLVNDDNLHRQILYGGHDLGKLKTIIAQQRLNVLNPLVNHEILNIRLNSANALNCIKRVDLVVDATDNFHSRYLINDACIQLNKPWVFGSVYKFEGQVTVFNYEGGPDLRDIYPKINDKTNVAAASETGLMGIIPGIIGSFQANEAIKVITGIGSVLSGKILYYNALTNNSWFVEFFKNPHNTIQNNETTSF